MTAKLDAVGAKLTAVSDRARYHLFQEKLAREGLIRECTLCIHRR